MKRLSGFKILRMSDPLIDTSQLRHESRVAIPPATLALNTGNGDVAFWGRSTPAFELLHGADYDPVELVELWNKIARPLLELRRKGLPMRLSAVIEKAVGFVADARQEGAREIALHSVIATEALLSPFDQPDSIAERFRALGAALIGKTGSERVEVYGKLQRLYSFRSKLVHQAGRGADLSDDDAQFALADFLTCLGEEARWAGERLDMELECDKGSFEAFYLSRVFGN